MLRGRSHARGEGHGTHHKTTVVGAVEVRTRKDAEDRAAKWKEAHGGGIPTKKLVYAGRLRPKVVSGKGADNLTSFIKENVAAGSTIRTDGWQGYNDLPEMGYSDDSLVLGGDPDKAESHLPMIHLVFSNLKTWILGTHHGRIAPHHLQAYLNEYVFRFNRRFYPMTAFNSVLGLAARAFASDLRATLLGEWVHPATWKNHNPRRECRPRARMCGAYVASVSTETQRAANHFSFRHYFKEDRMRQDGMLHFAALPIRR